MRGRRMAVTSVAGVLAALVVGTAAFAVATLTIDPTAKLAAKGAGVTVPVRVSCDPVGEGGFQSVSVQVTQEVEDEIASGFGSNNRFTCDGAEQVVEVLVPASGGGKAFRKGVALATADLIACSNGGPCQDARAEREIKIVK